jgi:hypothetical protein
MKTALTLVTLALALGAEASTAPRDACPTPVEGPYKNDQYGFAFVVPAGLRGIWQSPCALDDSGQCICIGNHGLRIDLGGGEVLGVFADYAAELDDPTVGDVLLAELRRLTGKDGAPATHITALETTHLKGRSGYRVRALSAASASNAEDPGLERVDYIFFFGGIRYVIYMSGPRARFTRGMPRLTELLKTWTWASHNRSRGP